MNTVCEKSFCTNHSNHQFSNSRKKRKKCWTMKPSNSPRRRIPNIPSNQTEVPPKNPLTSALIASCGSEGGRPRNLIRLRFRSSRFGRKKWSTAKVGADSEDCVISLDEKTKPLPPKMKIWNKKLKPTPPSQNILIVHVGRVWVSWPYLWGRPQYPFDLL